ncbi:MAG: patatin-like phospholipase family protein, partial [Chitinivibrionales bacterium]|nr:patatin-like phospholipase family protein [Chitinivibrionales bacterium]
MQKNNRRLAVALSGGGVRAAAFHLGLLARLAADDLLEHVVSLSTVSGGSLIAGLLFANAGNAWPGSRVLLGSLAQLKKVLTEKDLQRDTFRRLMFCPHLLFAPRANLLSRSLRRCWGVRGTLRDLSSKPRWIINATTYESGKNWRFIAGRRMGDYLVNYIDNPAVAVSDAVAASAAYPGLIGPFVIKTS